VNNVLNMQLIEQLTVANKTTTTLDMFCQQIHQAFQSQLESFSKLTLYQRQGEDFVGQIQLPDAVAVSQALTSKTHNSLWSAIMENQHHIAESDVYLPLYSHSEPRGILKFTISDTEVQSNIHWSILKNILSREFHNLLTNDTETSQPQHLLEAVIDIAYQISLAENDTEITNLLFKSMPKSVSHIALYRFNTPLSANNNPDEICLRTIASRESTTHIDDTVVLESDTVFSNGLTDKLLDGKFVIKNHTGASTDKLPQVLMESIQSTPIQSFVLNGLRAGKRLVGFIVFGSEKPTQIDTQYHRNFRILADQIGIIFENQRLLQNAQNTSSQLGEQIQIQRTLNELATFASSHKDEKQLLDKGSETLLQILPVDHVGIMMIDEDGKFADLVSDIPVRPTDIRRITVAGEAWERLANGEPQTIEHTVEQTNLPESSKQALNAMNIKSTIFIPFIDISGKLMGSIGLDSFESNISLTDEQIQTAQLITAQLVSQLQNLRLLKNSQLLANQMQQIAKFGETIQARLDLAEILQTTLHFANRVLDIDYINIVLYDAGLQKLIVKAYHLDERDVVIPLNNPVMPIEDTVIGAVWKNREPVYVRHMDQSPYHNPHAKDIKTLYAVALISQGVTRGAIEIGRSDTQGIRTMDSSVLLQMANQLAIALENATAYAQNQRLTQNKILANEIALQLQQQMDIDSLLNTTVTELGKALGAKRARIRLGVQQAIGDN
jgi:GAF domain-containing protein